MSLDPIPQEVWPHQGRPAGLVTRTAAAVVDFFVVLALLTGGYLALNALLFVINPRHFHLLAVSAVFSRTASLVVFAGYLAAAWTITGKTFGCQVMGLRVVSAAGGPVRAWVALVRAILYTLFPIGLVLCVMRHHRSLQDMLLRTRVVYDWRAQRDGRITPAPQPR
ncbi:RDD family protein [Kribbella sp. NPDC004875]|uniref:RDD family protein n=1 Tax=Kribbella sp. NPDC004875 TaxID=3364107 RepID=UPI003679D951